MSQSAENIYLITGTTRGIGLALVDQFASKDPSAVVYAGARNPYGPGSTKLKHIANKYPGRVIIVKCVSGDKEINEALAKEIFARHGRVDTVISNAAISNYIGKIHEAPVNEFPEHFAVNTVGAIVLFQSFYALLKASPYPRFIPISSGGGSIGLVPSFTPLDMAPYGPSKAALNWVARKIHFENEWLVCFPLCPGGVNTDMGILDAEQVEKLTRTPTEAASLLVDIIRASTREKDGGTFVSIEGGKHPW
ncbi:NAD(P)-binding protein [Pholiota conissans]|uniref:NAD(P)-binding protein n=1 Tax=Pholiota conissans TaxID=109636 RepID=A0A9P6CST3_9AGAR|nr:NAD(P)-binding protein [Pholiota conissans]